jgi:CheY-like chemotaxis protein
MTSVLVVDDEDVLLEMIAALIEDLGYRAITATNGREALEALRAEATAPSLIISDVMMPQMNGTSLARALRDDARFAHVPLVLMSAAGRPPQPGLADHFLPKPFELDQIEWLVERYARDGHG